MITDHKILDISDNKLWVFKLPISKIGKVRIFSPLCLKGRNLDLIS